MAHRSPPSTLIAQLSKFFPQFHLSHPEKGSVAFSAPVDSLRGEIMKRVHEDVLGHSHTPLSVNSKNHDYPFQPKFGRVRGILAPVDRSVRKAGSHGKVGVGPSVGFPIDSAIDSSYCCARKP